MLLRMRVGHHLGRERGQESRGGHRHEGSREAEHGAALVEDHAALVGGVVRDAGPVELVEVDALGGFRV
jgi:hypothetical protein